MLFPDEVRIFWRMSQPSRSRPAGQLGLSSVQLLCLVLSAAGPRISPTCDSFYLGHVLSGHLFYKFGITESDWYRIKQSIDSKCRTAWRRKQRGQSLAVKSFSRRTPSSSSYSASGRLRRRLPKAFACIQSAAQQLIRPGPTQCEPGLLGTP